MYLFINIVAAAHQLSVAFLLDDIPTAREKRLAKKRKRALAPYKRNVSVRYGPPTTNLLPKKRLEDILQDSDRQYLKKLTHLHEWQFFLLADLLKDLILRPRLRRDGTRPERIFKPSRHDFFHRLFFCLCWLNDGLHYRSRECETGWGKSSLQVDLVHVLIAIVEGLDDQVQWPDHNRRRELANVFQGVMKGCIGIADVKEYQIEKPTDKIKERESFSGKKKINSYRMLSVCDHTGRYIYVRVCLGRNDREVFTSSPLYLQEGDYFSEDEFVASDGGFEGDGRFRCSYNNPGNHPDRILFNLVFREIRTGVENAYSRVGTWFPLLGNNKKKIPYSEQVFFLAIHAATRLHNWIMNSENLSYSSLESPEVLYQRFY